MAAPTYTDVDGLGYILNGNPNATATGKNTYDTLSLQYICLGNPLYGPVGPTGGPPPVVTIVQRRPNGMRVGARSSNV